MKDIDRKEFWNFWGSKPYSSSSSVSDHGNTWQRACYHKDKEINELQSELDLAKETIIFQKDTEAKLRSEIEMLKVRVEELAYCQEAFYEATKKVGW